MVPRNVEVLKIRQVEFDNTTGKPVIFEPESEKMSQTVDRSRNLTGQVIVREIEAVEPDERQQRSREATGKFIVGEEHKFQSCEVGEIRNGTGETVPLEAQHS